METPTETITFLFTDIEKARRGSWRAAARRRERPCAATTRSCRRLLPRAAARCSRRRVTPSASPLRRRRSGGGGAGSPAPSDGRALRRGPPRPGADGALHSAVERRNDDYYRLPLSRVHRLLQAGHGGRRCCPAPPMSWSMTSCQRMRRSMTSVCTGSRTSSGRSTSSRSTTLLSPASFRPFARWRTCTTTFRINSPRSSGATR